MIGGLAGKKGGPQKGRIEKEEGISKNGVRQHVMPAIAHGEVECGRLTAMPGLPGGEKRRVPLTAGAGNQKERPGARPAPQEEPFEPKILSVPAQGVRLAQNRQAKPAQSRSANGRAGPQSAAVKKGKRLDRQIRAKDGGSQAGGVRPGRGAKIAATLFPEGRFARGPCRILRRKRGTQTFTTHLHND